MMESFSFMKASQCSGVYSNFTCCLVIKANGFAIFVNFDKLSTVACQSKKHMDLFECCWWVHLLNSLCFEGSGQMPLVFKLCPKYWGSLEKKWHLLSFMESFADQSFSKTFLMCDRCSSAVIMSSGYATVKSKSFKIPVINSGKYAGACGDPRVL